ncbi:MAG: (d)CMP kinase [Limisphaerales bacterium]
MAVVIAIDGPSASGKSTAARGVALALDFLYVDTGAMYRALAWRCRQLGTDLDDPKAIAAVCRRWKTRLHIAEGEPREVVLLVDGYAPRAELRTRETAAAASKVAVVPAVRAWMKRTQQSCAALGDLVMEGRDIGTNVFPDAAFKFWLDASPEERRRRRAAEGVADNLAERDRRDSQRAAAPLMPGLGVVVLDTSRLAAAEVVAGIVAAVRAGA